MPEPIVINDNVFVPADAIDMRAVRASGPGGQNVNKVSSKVEIRVDVEKISGLDFDTRSRLATIVRKRLDSSGRLVASSQRTRDQHRNLKDAEQKIRDWILQALEAPKPRIATRSTAAARVRRLEQKRRRARQKAVRRPPAADDEN